MSTLEWIPFPDPRFPVFGLPWFEETSPRLWRLPARLHHVIDADPWHTAFVPAGARIRFSTDSAVVGIRVCYPQRRHLYNLSAIGAMGIDVYVDDVYWGTCAPTADGILEVVFTSDPPAAPREVCLYLPIYHPVDVMAIGVQPDSQIGPPAAFSHRNPLVVYGGSITQGGCASRSGCTEIAFLCRTLNLDQVNFGFSGGARGQIGMAAAIAEVPAAVYVLQFGLNVETVEELQENYDPFVGALRERHATTPILCISPILVGRECYAEEHRTLLKRMRSVVQECVDRRKGTDPAIYYMDGLESLGPDDVDCLTDGIHPGDRGFALMAERIRPLLEQALRNASPVSPTQ